ncbi:MAG TPA: hypothetical protein VGD58_15480 [Herpetosiphonaceae bacterium]
MALQKIGKMSLKNQGGFVARIMFSYLLENGEKRLSEHTGDITLGQTKTVDPGDLGVPDGSVVWMYVFVVWGRDNEAKRAFLYEKGNPNTAHYSISGTTLDNELGLIDITQTQSLLAA